MQRTAWIVFLALLLGAVGSRFPLPVLAGEEPAFPGLDAEQSKLDQYWHDYSKFLMGLPDTPAEVKQGTDIQKAHWLFEKIGDKAHANGYEPNTGFSGRFKWWLKDGPRDRGACGDMSRMIEYAFKGAGISSGEYIVAEDWLIPGPDSDHGTFAVPDEHGNYQMFDLLEHGKDKGAFKGAGGSQWNGINVRAWSKKMFEYGYDTIKIQGKDPNRYSDFEEAAQVEDATKKYWQETEKYKNKRKEDVYLPSHTGAIQSPQKLLVSIPGIVKPGAAAKFRATLIYAGKGKTASITSSRDVTEAKWCQWSFTAGTPVAGEKGLVKAGCDTAGGSITAVAECKIMGKQLKSSATVKVETLPITQLTISAGAQQIEPGQSVTLTAKATYKNEYCKKEVTDPPGVQWTAGEGGQVSEGRLCIDPGKTNGTLKVCADLDGIHSNTLALTILAQKIKRIEVTAPKSVNACEVIEFEAWGYASDTSDTRERVTDKASWRFTGRCSVLTKNTVRADWPDDTITGKATIGDLPAAQAMVNVNPLSDSQPWFPLQDISIATRVRVGQSAENRALEFRCADDGPRPVPATSVAWISETPELLTCSNDGHCTGVKPGKAIVKLIYQGREITSRFVEVYDDEAGPSEEQFVDRGTSTQMEDQGRQGPAEEKIETRQSQASAEDGDPDTPSPQKPAGDAADVTQTPARGGKDPQERFDDRGTEIHIDDKPAMDVTVLTKPPPGQVPGFPEPSAAMGSNEGFTDAGTDVRSEHDGPDRLDQRRKPAPEETGGKQRLRIRPARIRGGGNAAYHIFATASRLGWAGGLSRYSVGPADQTIIDHLMIAAEHARAAHETSFQPTPAWPHWKSIKDQFIAWAGKLTRARSSLYRRRLAENLAGRYASLADQLGYQTVGDKRRAPNCDCCYCRLGYLMAYGQQALQIAQEAASQGNTALSEKARRDGVAHLGQALNVVDTLARVKPASGFCADLREVKPWLLSIIRGDGLGNQVATATKAWKLALERIMNPPPPTAIAQKAPPGPPPAHRLPPAERDEAGPRARGPEEDPGELTGEWAGPSHCGNSLRFTKRGSQYIGVRHRVSRYNRRNFGYQKGDLVYRVRRTGPNTYEGTRFGSKAQRHAKIMVLGNFSADLDNRFLIRLPWSGPGDCDSKSMKACDNPFLAWGGKIGGLPGALITMTGCHRAEELAVWTAGCREDAQGGRICIIEKEYREISAKAMLLKRGYQPVHGPDYLNRCLLFVQGKLGTRARKAAPSGKGRSGLLGK